MSIGKEFTADFISSLSNFNQDNFDIRTRMNI